MLSALPPSASTKARAAPPLGVHGSMVSASKSRDVTVSTSGSALASTDIRFVVKPAYNWVANATITSDGWTEITGTYTVPANVVATETQVYIGSTNQSGPY